MNLNIRGFSVRLVLGSVVLFLGSGAGTGLSPKDPVQELGESSWRTPSAVSWSSAQTLTPEMERAILKKFLDRSGNLSPKKLDDTRDEFATRKRQLSLALHEKYGADTSKSPSEVEEKVAKYKGMVAYELIEELLQHLSQTGDHVAAARILELDFALKSEGGPSTIEIVLERADALLASWKIPLGFDSEREAKNLVHPVTQARVTARELRDAQNDSALVDPSALDPVAGSTFWKRIDPTRVRSVKEHFQGGQYPLLEGIHAEFPDDGVADYDEVAKSQSSPKIEITYRGKDGKKYKARLKFGREVHSDPTVSALLSLTGYSTDIVKNYRSFKLRLPGMDLQGLKRELHTYYSPDSVLHPMEMDPWIQSTGRDENGFYVVFRDVLIEVAPKEIIRLGPWGFNSLGHQELREVRGLSLFNLWVGNVDAREYRNNKVVLKKTSNGLEMHHLQHDSGLALGGLLAETPGVFDWDLVTQVTGAAVSVSHRALFRDPLEKSVTAADARWATRLIAALSRSQIEESVGLGNWPASIARLLTEKLIHRRNKLVQALGLDHEFAMLPVDRTLSTEDGMVKDGELKVDRVDSWATEFGSYYHRLLRPFGKVIQKLLAKSVVDGARGMEFVPINEVEIGPDGGIYSDVLIKLDRKITKNPDAKTEHERILVEDIFKIGFRLGAGIVVSGHTTFWKEFRLVYPVRTEMDGKYSKHFALNLFLPFQIWGEKLPGRFVLVTETALEGGGRISVTSTAGEQVLALGVDGQVSKLVLSRTAIERTEAGDYRIFQDTEKSLHSQVRAFVRLFSLLRVPFLQSENFTQGRLQGKLLSIPAALLENSPEGAWALSSVIRHGSIEALEEWSVGRAESRPFHGNFELKKRRWSILGFFGMRSQSEKIEIAELNLDQRRSFHERNWAFFDRHESHSVEWLALGRLDHAGIPERLSLRLAIDDNFTSSRELGEGYIGLINRVAQRKLIDFNPELVSRNQRWGGTETQVDVLYSREAIEKMINLSRQEFWEIFRTQMGWSSKEFARVQWTYQTRAAHHPKGAYGVPAIMTDAERAYSKAREFAYYAYRGGNDRRIELENFMRAIKETLGGARHVFDTLMIEVFNRYVGEKNLSIEASISPPFGQESLFPGGGPIRGRWNPTDFAPGEAVTPVFLFPNDPIETWRFFEGWKALAG